MAVQSTRSAYEYAEWVKPAKFEVGDLRDCLMYDMEEIGESGRFPMFLYPLAQTIDVLYQSMCSGAYAFGRDDLSFVAILDRDANDIASICY